jgi:hypothetical protein
MNFLRRIPAIPCLISLAVIVTGGFAVPPIRDAANGTEVAEAYLVRSLGYVAMSPVSEVLDTLTLLSARQHIALLVGVLVLFVLWRTLVSRAGATAKQHALTTVALVAALGLTYAAGAILPRPMAALGADNANIVKIDFHSHTSASHDGHQSVEQLREWHRGAGFDVAYVTDHATVSGAEQGMANNPNPVGTGVTLLQSIETTWSGEHVSIPGAQRIYKGLLTANLADVDTQGLRLASLVPGREPIVIWNHPHDLTQLKPATGPTTDGIRAIEVVNGAPKDIDNERRGRQQLVLMARGGDVALTTGSDNHGYGRASPGWTLMLIVGWRGATPDALALEIDKVLRDGKFAATKVVERRVADAGDSALLLAMSVFTVPYRMLTTLSGDERVSWLVWTWLLFAAGQIARGAWPTPPLRSRP